jgi:hypothetical protein
MDFRIPDLTTSSYIFVHMTQFVSMCVIAGSIPAVFEPHFRTVPHERCRGQSWVTTLQAAFRRYSNRVSVLFHMNAAGVKVG